MVSRAEIEQAYEYQGLDRRVIWEREFKKPETEVSVWAKLLDAQQAIDTVGELIRVRDDTRSYLVRHSGYIIGQFIFDEGVAWHILGVEPLNRRGWVVLSCEYQSALSESRPDRPQAAQ